MIIFIPFAPLSLVPSSPNVYHFNPIAFVEQIKRGMPLLHPPIKNPQLCVYTQGGGEAHYWGSFGDKIRSTNRNKSHSGIDIFAIPGTDVYACADGTIIKAYTSSSLAGRVLSLKIDDKEKLLQVRKNNFEPYYKAYGEIIDNKFDDEKNIYLVYMHLEEFLVSQGDKVVAGQIIARSGNSGYNGKNFSTKNPHLHFEVSNNISSAGLANKSNPLQFFDVKHSYELTKDELQAQKDAKTKEYK